MEAVKIDVQEDEAKEFPSDNESEIGEGKAEASEKEKNEVSSSSEASESSERLKRKKRKRRARKLSTSSSDCSSCEENSVVKQQNPKLELLHNCAPPLKDDPTVEDFFDVKRTFCQELSPQRDYKINPQETAKIYFEGVKVAENHVAHVVPCEHLREKYIEAEQPFTLFKNLRERGFWMTFYNKGKDQVVLRHKQPLVFVYMTKMESFFVTHTFKYKSQEQAQQMGVPFEGLTLPWQRKWQEEQKQEKRRRRQRSFSPPRDRDERRRAYYHRYDTPHADFSGADRGGRRYDWAPNMRHEYYSTALPYRYPQLPPPPPPPSY